MTTFLIPPLEVGICLHGLMLQWSRERERESERGKRESERESERG